MITAPPIALRPYSAPCGPFRTSMLSMSYSSWLNCEGFAIRTPSIRTATEGSLLRAWEMPRTTMKEVPWFCVWTIVMLGVRAMKSCGRTIPADWISWALKAFTTTGTSSSVSSRLRAVTMTSSISVLCAMAGTATAAARIAATAVVRHVPLGVSMKVSAFRVRLPPAAAGRARHLRAEHRGPGDHRLELSESDIPAQVLETAVGRDDHVFRAHEGQRAPDARRHGLRRLHVGTSEVEHAEHDLLAFERFEDRAVEVGLGGFEGDLLAVAARELRQERVGRRASVDERRIAEADVDRRGAGHALERPVQRLETVLARLVGPRLHVGLVDLDDVRARREEVADLAVERRGVVRRRELAAAAVVVDLRLLRHREGSRDRDLDGPRRVAAQELQVAHADRVAPADRSRHARHRDRVAAAVERRAGVVEVDAFQRVGEQVRVAFAADFAVGDDVEAGGLLRADRKDRGVVLRLLQVRRRDAPQLACAHARWKAPGELLAVDEPVRLRHAADQGRGKQGGARVGHRPIPRPGARGAPRHPASHRSLRARPGSRRHAG